MMSIGAFNKILKFINEGSPILAVKDSNEYINPREIRMNDLIDLTLSNDVSFYVYDEYKDSYLEMKEIE